MGATDAQLAAVAAGDYGTFDPAWRAAFAYADEMTPTGGVVGDATFGALSSHWSAPQIVEITAVITLFNYFNRFAVALHVPVTR